MGKDIKTAILLTSVLGLSAFCSVTPAMANTPSITAYYNNLKGFNTAANTPPIQVNFDNIPIANAGPASTEGTDITNSTISGVTFKKHGNSSELYVVKAADTFTPVTGFINGAGVPTTYTNKLIPTSGENVLSPGGIELAPGPNPTFEYDSLEMDFTHPVSAVGFDVLLQSEDVWSGVGIYVYDSTGALLGGTSNMPTNSAPGGSPPGDVFVGFTSPTANISKIVVTDGDNNNQFPDSNIGIDTIRYNATDTQPPVTTANLTPLSANGIGNNGWYTSGVNVSLNATDDSSGVAKTQYSFDGTDWVQYNGPFTIPKDGQYSLWYRSIDNAGNMETPHVMTINIDKTPPVTTATVTPVSASGIGNNGWYTSNVSVSLNPTDTGSGVYATQYSLDGGITWLNYSGPFDLSTEGTNNILYRSIDNAGNVEASKTLTVKIDKTPPALSIQLDNKVLWPPNHKMIPIHATVNASDSASGIASVVLTSITSNEPDEGLGDGDMPHDIQKADFGTYDTDFLVRAERSGLGTGRVYTVTYTATDNAGNVTTATATITVPHDQSNGVR